jgi:hypothetical protein
VLRQLPLEIGQAITVHHVMHVREVSVRTMLEHRKLVRTTVPPIDYVISYARGVCIYLTNYLTN